MIVKWHCRGCNQEGKFTKNIIDMIKLSPDEKNFFKLAITFVRRVIHDTCPGADIGVMIERNEDK